MTTMTTEQLAIDVGAVHYSPAPFRVVKGLSFTYVQLQAFYETAKKEGRDELQKELSEQPAVWYMYRDCFGYWRNFNEAEASLMVKRGDRWAAFDKMIRRPLPPQTNKEG